MTLYQNKYRVESTRLPEYDYAANGKYFVTICTNKREYFLGNIIGGETKLSIIGEVANSYWSEIPEHFKHVSVDAYVIMPNHVHGIIVIDRPDAVETDRDRSPQSNKFGPLKPGSLQAIVHAYKSSVTRWCRKHGDNDFAWQEGFYEEIIVTDRSLNNIREYIINNPAKWEEDKNNPAGLRM